MEAARLPLVPASVNLYPWIASTSFELQQSGSVSRFDDCDAVADLHGLEVVLSGQPAVQLSGTVTTRDGTIRSQIRGSALGGQFDFDGQLAFSADGPSGTAELHCHDMCTDALPMGVLPAGVRTAASAGMNMSAAFADGVIRLKGQSNTTINDTVIYGVAVAPVRIDVAVDGAIGLDAASNRSHGMILANVVSDGVSVNTLFESMATRGPATDHRSSTHDSAWASTSPAPRPLTSSGQVRAQAQLAIPLATLFDPATFRLEGEVDTTGVMVNDVETTAGVVAIGLDGGVATVRFDDLRAQDKIANCALTLDGSLQAGLQPESELRAELHIVDLAAATVARLAGVSDREIDGTFSAHALIACPIQHLQAAEMWRGRADFRADSIRVDGQPLANAEGRCEVKDGQLVLQTLQGSLAGGEISGAGRISLTTPFAFRSQMALRGVNMESIANITQSLPRQTVGGDIDVSIIADGDIATRSWDVRGRVLGSGLRVGSRAIEVTQLDFFASPKTIAVATPPKGFFGGDLNITASLSGPSRRHTGSASVWPDSQRSCRDNCRVVGVRRNS